MKRELTYSFFSAQNPAGTAGSVRFSERQVVRSSNGENRLTPDPIVRATVEYRNAMGLRKPRALEVLRQTVQTDAASADTVLRNIRNAAETLLSSDYKDRYEDAVQVLLITGPDLVQNLALDLAGVSEDLSRVIVRALGRCKDFATLRRYTGMGSLGFREAVINALDDVDSSESRELLRKIQSDSTEPEVIRNIAAELVAQ